MWLTCEEFQRNFFWSNNLLRLHSFFFVSKVQIMLSYHMLSVHYTFLLVCKAQKLKFQVTCQRSIYESHVLQDFEIKTQTFCVKRLFWLVISSIPCHFNCVFKAILMLMVLRCIDWNGPSSFKAAIFLMRCLVILYLSIHNVLILSFDDIFCATLGFAFCMPIYQSNVWILFNLCSTHHFWTMFRTQEN